MNNKRLFVAGLPWSIDDNGLRDLFAQCGIVTYSKVIIDRDTGRSKGFGFVEFESQQEADNAIQELNGSKLEGRTLVVNVARAQADRGNR